MLSSLAAVKCNPYAVPYPTGSKDLLPLTDSAKPDCGVMLTNYCGLQAILDDAVSIESWNATDLYYVSSSPHKVSTLDFMLTEFCILPRTANSFFRVTCELQSERDILCWLSPAQKDKINNLSIYYSNFQLVVSIFLNCSHSTCTSNTSTFGLERYVRCFLGSVKNGCTNRDWLSFQTKDNRHLWKHLFGMGAQKLCTTTICSEAKPTWN